MEINLSEDQKYAANKIWKWLAHDSDKQYLTFGGYAGTGKTTLLAAFRKKIHELKPDLKIAFCSYTGKATRVLHATLREMKALYGEDNVSTIHSLIYSPVTNQQKEIVGWSRKDDLQYDLIVIDEASMVDEEIWQDLLRYKIKILAVGDHGQLPPIKGKFNLMQEPEIRLEKIHRQSEGNPIIEVSIQARKLGAIEFADYGEFVKKFDRSQPEAGEIMNELLSNYKPNCLILCGYNHTRVKLNSFVRQSLGFETQEPRPGDRVICLRNNHEKEIYNGMLGTIQSISLEDDGKWYFAEIEMDGEERLYKGLILVEQFNNKQTMNFTNDRKKTTAGDLFDFGYALTVHKAQGSQANTVVLLEERFKQMDDEMWKRWLYTAVTRAEKELYIFG